MRSHTSRYQKKKKNSRSRWLRHIVLASFLLGVAGMIGYSIITTFQKRYVVEKEKQEFLSQIEQINQESQELAKIQDFISTQEYQEREAKQKLNLENPGEEAVIVTPASIVESLPKEEVVAVLKEPKSAERIAAQTNPEKWWAFFFDKERL